MTLFNEMLAGDADIYRAEGVLAERLNVDLPAAANVLRSHARYRSIPLVEAAREVLRHEEPAPQILDPWGSC